MSTWRWLAAGLLSFFAIGAHPGFVNLQALGLILIARGLAGRWMEAGPGGRARWAAALRALVTGGSLAIEAIVTEGGANAEPDPVRVPLAELLNSPRADHSGPARQHRR